MILKLSDLEGLCDKEGNEVIEHLVNMCHAKAVHIRQYSEALSMAWTKAAQALDKVYFPY